MMNGDNWLLPELITGAIAPFFGSWIFREVHFPPICSSAGSPPAKYSKIQCGSLLFITCSDLHRWFDNHTIMHHVVAHL